MVRSTDEQGANARPAISEATFLLALSVAAYIYTYSHQRAFLGTFGVDDMFVSIGLDSIVRAGAALLIFAILILQFLLVPAKWLRAVMLLVFAFRVPLIVALLWLPLYLHLGVNWATLIMGSVVVSFALIDVGSILVAWRRGRSFNDYISKEIEIHSEVMRDTTDSKVAEIVGGGLWTLLLLLTFGSFVLGTFVGERDGSRQQNFLGFDDRNESYLIVHHNSESYIAVGYEERKDADPKLTGRVRLIESIDDQGITLEMRQFNPRPVLKDPPVRQSFREWYKNNF